MGIYFSYILVKYTKRKFNYVIYKKAYFQSTEIGKNFGTPQITFKRFKIKIEINISSWSAVQFRVTKYFFHSLTMSCEHADIHQKWKNACVCASFLFIRVCHARVIYLVLNLVWCARCEWHMLFCAFVTKNY